MRNTSRPQPVISMGGVSADQALRSYKWSYIRLAALHLRWQNLWSYWAIAVVLTLLGRAISLDNFLITKVFVSKTGEEVSRWYTRMTPRIFGLKGAFSKNSRQNIFFANPKTDQAKLFLSRILEH
jgi:hypothetical protein